MPYQINNHRIVYLDYAAATPLSAAARTALLSALDGSYGNPSSPHVAGRYAHDLLANARRQLSRALGVEPSEIILTGSGTESDNLALFGLARAHRAHGNHIIVSAIEHAAVLAAAKQLEQEGFSVTYLPVNGTGLIAAADVALALRPETILVSIMYANNEIGTIEPIQAVANVCRTYRPGSQYPLVHTDACQAVGLLPVSPRTLGVDAMTINSAKISGPKGIGLLYLRHGVHSVPVIVGGGQERGLRAGTENGALAAGFAAALTEAVLCTDEHFAKMRDLQQYFITALSAAVPGVRFNGHPTKRLPNNVHITIPEVEGESLLLLMSEARVCCATGSACASHELAPSHVLSAIGQDEHIIHGSLRFTFGRDTTKSELNYAARVLARAVKRLRAITACTTRVYKDAQTTSI